MSQIPQEQRLVALRRLLADQNLTAYLVPKTDEFQLEYVPPCNDRLAWLTEFTGSAGLAIVGEEQAALFTDGRYTEQAKRQTHSDMWQHRPLRGGPTSWVESNIPAKARIGYDPRLHTPLSLDWLRDVARRIGFSLVAVAHNLVDTIWTERPPPPRSPVEIYPENFAGQSADSKRQRIAAQLVQEGVAGLVITAPANWAWLLNVRAQDLAHTPLALGYCILASNRDVVIFLDATQWSPAVQSIVAATTCGHTRFEPLENFQQALETWKGKRVRVSRGSASQWVLDVLTSSGAMADVGTDPCSLAKACKTPQELRGIAAAHIRDGVALTRFLHWLSQNALQSQTEWTLVEKLDEFRRNGEHYRSLSFSTISAFGPSGSSPHYTVTPKIALPITPGNLYLVDSGGQYVDGTTDVTRVAAIGKPTVEMQERYTQVLRGHIALARAQFPSGITGPQLDPLARQFLWSTGVDYAHGTGHGVGCFLSVHEGPQGISPRPNTVELKVGMVLSNEPGYYKPGHFGIRIENLVAVVEVRPQPPGAEATVLGFEQLTLCPYERQLIVASAMTTEERQWVDAYHARVCATLSPLLPDTTAQWLSEQCRPLPIVN